MRSNIENKHRISRKRFLQICGTVVAGGGILGLTGILFRRTPALAGEDLRIQTLVEQSQSSPYKLVSSFRVPDRIEAFELYDDKLIVASPNNISIYDPDGSLQNNFAVGSNLRDIAIDKGLIYLLFPTRVEVYSENGEWLRDWGADNEKSDYCSMAVTPGAVFITDAGMKNIAKFTTEGNFVQFIQSPNRFIIPSYTFGIMYADGVLYCSNPGRHQVESYSLNGEYLGAFGKAGGAAGNFCGCCNPVHLSYTASGEIITSEKGNPRISCYSPDGEFRSVLLDTKSLGGGNVAYDIKVKDDQLFVAGKDMVSIFRYDKILAANTACSTCGVSKCPLRKGIEI